MNVDFAQPSQHKILFDEAWLYCACLFYNGYSDWRLPYYSEVYKEIKEMNGWYNHYTNHGWYNADDPLDQSFYYAFPVRDI